MMQLQVDVDNLWVYEQEYGIKISKDSGYIYKQSLPLFLDLLKHYQLKATFMVIGKDLRLQTARAFCRRAIREGHQIGNHTWSHPTLFGSLSYDQKQQEIIKAHRVIVTACGKRPVGFRGPGYYVDEDVRSIVKNHKYQYDASILPGFAQLLMSWYAKLHGGENKHKIFGRAVDIFSNTKSHVVDGLQELPISVLPFLRLPIHTTFAYTFGPLYRELILKYLSSKPEYVLYVFHVVDFADLPQQDRNYPVVPLRFTFEERMQFVNAVLYTLAI